VKHRTLLAVFLTALAVLGLSSCATTNHLQTLTMTATTPALTGGFFNLQGEGGTLQLKVWANYSDKGTLDVTNQSVYTIIVTPTNSQDAFGFQLPNPPNTVQLDKTGLLTAVTPFDCTWVDTGTADKPAWFLSGSYQITATYKGVTSQPVYVGVASSAGDNSSGNNPSFLCGPTT